MSILTQLVNFALKDVQSIITSLVLGLITVLILFTFKFYFITLRQYPKGPTPWPVLGNILMFKNRMSYELMIELSKVYGPVYTLWVGMKPMVILATNDVINEALKDKRNDFGGRPDFNFREVTLVKPNTNDVIFEDWGRPWEVLRRVAHSAARKFAVNPSLPALEVSVIDEVVGLMLKKEGLNHSFNPKDYIYLMVYSIIASTAAGKSYSIEDKEFLALKDANDAGIEYQADLTVVEFIPLLLYVPSYRRMYQEIVRLAKVQNDWSKEKFTSHLKTYQPGVIRDFCDALIFAKKEAQIADAEATNHLTDGNLMNVVNNLFQAGTETTRMTLMWALLLIADNPEVQAKLRAEIADVIGDDIPNNDHRHKCHYVQSFIAEVMRFKPIVPMSVPRKTIVDCSVGDHKLIQGTVVVPVLYTQLHDREIWGDPEVFRPERFMDPSTGVHTTRNNNAFTPFSVGRRACLGKKLALINLFIEITRLLQKTKGFKFVLPKGPGSVSLDPDPKQPASFAAKDYEIMIVGDDNNNEG